MPRNMSADLASRCGLPEGVTVYHLKLCELYVTASNTATSSSKEPHYASNAVLHFLVSCPVVHILRCDFPKYFLCSSVVILKQMCLLPLKGNTGRLEGIEFPCSLLVKTSIFNAAGFCIKLITMEAI